MKTALTIAGADPSGRAGIQADLRAFEAFGLRGLSVITALTAQDGVTVSTVVPVSPAFIKEQTRVLLAGFSPAAIKIGMLATTENARAVASVIRSAGLERVVLDPVLRSTGGVPLMDEKGIGAVKGLIKLAAVVTPNLDEASALTGCDVTDIPGMEEAARRLHLKGAGYVLVKGGHLEGDPVDILFDGKRLYRYTGKRLKKPASVLHGTGCMLSSAIAAGLARGRSVRRSVEDARAYVTKVLAERR